jgi:peroxiredoxin
MLHRRVVATALALVTLASAFAADNLRPIGKRVAANTFALTDSQGQPVSSAGLEGQVVLLNFWATWCTGCKEEMPWFMEFQQKYRASGLASIGVSLDEDGWTSVRPYLVTHPIDYPIAVADQNFARRFGFEGALPVTMLIDRAGRVAEVHQGKVDKDALEAHIRLLLNER